jgi:hypothetical protein
MKLLGDRYLANTLSRLVEQVYRERESCEVDPNRLESRDDLKRNWKRLMGHANEFWETINHSVEMCPWCVYLSI